MIVLAKSAIKTVISVLIVGISIVISALKALLQRRSIESYIQGKHLVKLFEEKKNVSDDKTLN